MVICWIRALRKPIPGWPNVINISLFIWNPNDKTMHGFNLWEVGRSKINCLQLKKNYLVTLTS